MLNFILKISEKSICPKERWATLCHSARHPRGLSDLCHELCLRSGGGDAAFTEPLGWGSAVLGFFPEKSRGVFANLMKILSFSRFEDEANESQSKQTTCSPPAWTWCSLGIGFSRNFFFKKFYWRTVDLQCCVSFRCTAK